MSDSIYRRIPPDRPATPEELAEHYAPVARHWAFRLHVEGRDVQRSLEDLEQDAWVGIMEAWRLWEPGRGTTFKTYANNWARWAVLNGGRRADVGLYRAYIRDRKLYRRILQITSLDQPVGDGRAAPGSLLADPGAEAAHDGHLAWGSFLKLVAMVPNPRVRKILVWYYGFDRTLEDIGRELGGISRERIRQLLVEGREDIRRGLEGER